MKAIQISLVLVILFLTQILNGQQRQSKHLPDKMGPIDSFDIELLNIDIEMVASNFREIGAHVFKPISAVESPVVFSGKLLKNHIEANKISMILHMRNPGAIGSQQNTPYVSI